MDEKLENIIDSVNIPSNLVGYMYWVDALRLAINYNGTTYKYPIYNFYVDVARLNNTNYICVERSLRYARQYSNIQVKTNGQFLSELVKLYNRRYNKYE